MLHRLTFTVLLAVCLLLSGCAGGPSGSRPAVATVGSSDPSAGTAVAAPETGCGSDSRAAGSTGTVSVTVNGTVREARLHVPSGYDGTTPTAVILAFVGHGMSTDKLESFSDLDGGDAFVLYPQPAGTDPQNGWESAPYASGQDDVAFVGALLDTLQARACVDTRRIFAAGISNGGGFVSLLSCRLPERIAAFAVVSGAAYPADNPTCPSATAVPIVEFHGTADPVIPYDGGTRHDATIEPVAQWLDEQAQRNACAPSPTRTSIGSDVVEQEWSGCHGRGALVHYRVEGGGHTWPGATAESGPGAITRTISATRIIEDFFAAHTLS